MKRVSWGGMGELGGTVEYLYWSTRRTSRFMEDNGFSIQPVTQTLTSPSFVWLPTFSRSKTSASGTRPQIAKTIEGALGQTAVTRFNAPGPIQYAKGTGVVVFSEFMHAFSRRKYDRRPTVIFTMADHSRRDRESVAIVLFGSMDNYPEYIQDAGPKQTYGWSSSAAPTVFNFIKSHGKDLGRPPNGGTPGELAVSAFQIAYSQGIGGFNRTFHGMHRPWMRAYTYGDAREAEWLAQIYLDMSREELEAEGISTNDYAYNFPVSRILVGAPLWIRTPSPRSVRIYANCDSLDMSLDEDEPIKDLVYNPIWPIFRLRSGGKHRSRRRIT
jgi:hypothetical protein